MKKAFLLHPNGNMNGNLRWPSRNEFERDNISASLDKICKLGYWASAFPEGDGITFTKDNYSPSKALDDFRNSFEWIEIEECELSDLQNKMSEILKEQKCKCKVLVPIGKLWINSAFKIGGFNFWPPVEENGFSANEHPWFGYFVGDTSIFKISEQSFGQWDGEIRKEEDLLRHPLIELDINVYESDLLGINTDISAEMRLLRIASEQADRALDLLRITQCSFKKIEYLPNRAGQLDNGFTVAYFMPELKEYRETLLQHIVYPVRASNNWLGLEAEYVSEPYIEWLARILKGDSSSKIELAIRSSIIALSQAFYTVYEEARFLALVFALDGLCSPDPRWKAWKHRTYIAALSSGGNIHTYEHDLKIFEYIYSDIRNKLVHSGASFISIKDVDSKYVSDIVLSLIIRCIFIFYQKGLSSKDDLHNFARGILSQGKFEQCTKKVIDYYDNKRGITTHSKQRPKW